MAECGAIFACHPIIKSKVRVAEHAVIRECRDCHMKLKTAIQLDTAPQGRTVMPTLRIFKALGVLLNPC